MNDSNKVTIRCGAKFFRFINDQLEIIRIKKIDSKDNKERVKYFTEDKELKSMSYDYLMKNYEMLAPDGMIIITVVGTNAADDVIVGLSNFKNLSQEPDVICRQGIADVFTNITNKDEGTLYIGCSVSKSTCPVDIDYKWVYSCQCIKGNPLSILVYLDDTLDDILSLFSTKRYDQVLKDSAKSIIEQFSKFNIVGAKETLKELLAENNFMYDFRKLFGIIEVPFHIDSESDQLDDHNWLFLESELKANIMETYLIQYSREINLKSIARDYKLISSAIDGFDKVYICGYDVSDNKYVPRTIM